MISQICPHRHHKFLIASSHNSRILKNKPNTARDKHAHQMIIEPDTTEQYVRSHETTDNTCHGKPIGDTTPDNVKTNCHNKEYTDEEIKNIHILLRSRST